MKLCQFPQTMYIRLIGFAQMFTKLRFGEIWLVNHAQWWCGKPNETAPPCCKSEKASVHFLCEYLTINIGIQLEINEMFRRVCSMQIYTNRFQSLERRLQFFGWCENILFEFDESTTIVAVNSRRFGCCETLAFVQRRREQITPFVSAQSFVHQREIETHQNWCYIL